MSETVSATIPVEAPASPRHVAIIMDGNNRWAKLKKLGGIAGHRAGVGAVRAVVETCAMRQVEVLTLFAFSSENWRRPEDEVGALMKLFLIALKREVKKLDRNNIRLRIIGDRGRFSNTLQEHMAAAEEATADNTGMTLVIAANYGGQWDLTQAARQLALEVEAGSRAAASIDEAALQSKLALGALPPPDLLIRTAGEQRISNFLLWHLAYTEFYFSSVYWPDFKHQEMQKALDDYSLRKRRFGRTDDQVDSTEPTVTLLRRASS